VLVCIWIALHVYCWVNRLLSQPEISVENTPGDADKPTTANDSFVTLPSTKSNSVAEPEVGQNTFSGKSVNKSRVRKRCSSAVSKSLSLLPASLPVASAASSSALAAAVRAQASTNISAKPDNVFSASVTIGEVKVNRTSSAISYPVTSCSMNATDTSANTVTDTSTNGCFVKTPNAESNFVNPEVDQSTTIGKPTLTGKVIDKSCAAKRGLSAVPESLTLSPSPSLLVVTATSSCAAVSLPGRSATGTQPVAAGPSNSAVTSSISRQNVRAPLALNIAESGSFIQTKNADVDAVRPVTVEDNSSCTNVQASANPLSSNRLDTVEPTPVNFTPKTGNITVPSTQHFTRSSVSLLSPDMTLHRAPAAARKPQASSETSEHLAASTVESSSATPDDVIVCSEVTNREVRAKCASNVVSYALQNCARDDTKVSPVVALPLQPSSSPPSLSPLLSSSSSSHHGTSYMPKQSDRESASVDTQPLNTAITGGTATDERYQFPLSDDYDFRLVCNTCFKPQTEEMMPERAHSCRQDMLAVKKIGTDEWYWIRQRNISVTFKGDYVMCRYGKDCYNRMKRCTYAHCDAERQLWNLEKMKSTFSVAEFISEHKTSASVCSVKSLLDKYPVSRSFIFLN